MSTVTRGADGALQSMHQQDLPSTSGHTTNLNALRILSQNLIREQEEEEERDRQFFMTLMICIIAGFAGYLVYIEA